MDHGSETKTKTKKRRRPPPRKVFHAAQDARGTYKKEDRPPEETRLGGFIFILNGVFTKITYVGAILAGLQLLYQSYMLARYGNWPAFPASLYLGRLSAVFRKPMEGQTETFMYFVSSNVSFGVFLIIIGVIGFMICQIFSPRRL